jgi:hypothetical protein
MEKAFDVKTSSEHHRDSNLIKKSFCNFLFYNFTGQWVVLFVLNSHGQIYTKIKKQ